MANFTETATWAANVAGIDNGDQLNETEINAAPKTLTDRGLYLRTHGSIWARSVTTHLLPIINGGSEAGVWEQHPTLGVQQIDVSSVSSYYQLELGAESAVTVTQIRARLAPAAGHGGLPANMPSVALWYWDVSTGSSFIVATQGDTSGSVGVYEAQHLVTLTLSHALSISGRRYVIYVNGESSTNAATGLRLVSLDISWTAPS